MQISTPSDLISGFFARHYPSKLPGEIVNAAIMAANNDTYTPWEIDVTKMSFSNCPVNDPDWILLSAGGGDILLKGMDFTTGSNNVVTLHRFLGTQLSYKADVNTHKCLVWCGKVLNDFSVTYPSGTYLQLTQRIAEYTDSPIFQEDGVIEDISLVNGNWNVITDKEAFKLNTNNTPTNIVGDIISKGDSVGTAWELVGLDNNTVSDIALPPSLYRPSGSGYIVFENTQVGTATNTAQDLTRTRFYLNGDTNDIDDFWNYIENNNVEGHTIANALDTRANPFGEPSVTDIPATVNPAKFLINMVFNKNAYMIITYPNKFGSNRNLKALKNYAASPYVTLWEVPGGVPALSPYLSSF